MPELPEVEAICRKLRRQVIGARIVRARVLRTRTSLPQKPARVAKLARAKVIESIGRRGKHILFELSGGLALRVHLRMTGDMYVAGDRLQIPPTARAFFELDRGRVLVFDDSRALGVLQIQPAAEIDGLLKDLGPEPLSPKFTVASFAEIARRSRQPAKLFLMDQRHVAGLGNIYAAEALFRAGIHPGKPMKQISPRKLQRLHAAIVHVLRDAVKSACIACYRPGRFQEAEKFFLAVYDREGEPCFVCGREIRRTSQGGRSTYNCPGCQR
jgi:formamidopyrimidine-DNA glycosylase